MKTGTPLPRGSAGRRQVACSVVSGNPFVDPQSPRLPRPPGLSSGLRAAVGSALALSALAPLGAPAGGLSLYEIATPDVGLASAGYAARAQDASTLFKNPAGMSQLEGSQLQTGIQLLYGDVQFSPDANTSVRLGNNGGGNAIGLLPAASVFFVQELSEKFSVGFGLFSYFGLMAQYNNDWVGRYYVQQGTLVGVTLMPSLSYKVNDWLSVGAGLNAMDGYLKSQLAVNNVDPGFGDGQMELKDSAWGFGANVGVLVEPAKGTRVGVAYLSPLKLDFKDTPSFSNLGPGLSALLGTPPNLNLGMTVPQSVMVSGYHELNERWALMADFGWQNWSQFGKADVGVEFADGTATPQARTINLNYQDTFHGALGAQYRPCDTWTFTAGMAYDSSAVSEANRTVTAPMGVAWRFGVGATWRVSQAVDLNAAYEFLWAGDMSVDQGTDLSLRGRVSGAYNNSNFSFFTLNLTWKL